jgi:hypothetical protein
MKRTIKKIRQKKKHAVIRCQSIIGCASVETLSHLSTILAILALLFHSFLKVNKHINNDCHYNKAANTHPPSS